MKTRHASPIIFIIPLHPPVTNNSPSPQAPTHRQPNPPPPIRRPVRIPHAKPHMSRRPLATLLRQQLIDHIHRLPSAYLGPYFRADVCGRGPNNSNIGASAGNFVVFAVGG